MNKRQEQAEATRERMLVAAQGVFESKGYQATSVAAITKAADTAHGTFYLYFRNKDDVFVRVIAAIGEEMRELSRSRLVGDRHESLEGVIRVFFEVFVRYAALWRALLEGMMLSPAIEELWWATTRSFVDRIAHRLEREQEAGLVRKLDTRQSAEALASMVEWTAFRHFGSVRRVGDPLVQPTNDEIDQVVAAVTDLWFHAVYGLAQIAPTD